MKNTLTLSLFTLFLSVTTLGQPKPEDQKIINGAKAFFKWYEQTWDTRMTASNLSSYQFWLDKNGKPEENEGAGCPCKLDTIARNKFFAWIDKLAPLVSNHYKQDVKIEINTIAKQLSDPSNKPKYPEYYESFYFALFHFFPGNGGAPTFSKTGIYLPSAKWTVKKTDETHADVTVAFRENPNKATSLLTYTLPMIVENGTWKLSGPIIDSQY